MSIPFNVWSMERYCWSWWMDLGVVVVGSKSWFKLLRTVWIRICRILGFSGFYSVFFCPKLLQSSAITKSSAIFFNPKILQILIQTFTHCLNQDLQDSWIFGILFCFLSVLYFYNLLQSSAILKSCKSWFKLLRTVWIRICRILGFEGFYFVFYLS